MWRWSVQYVSMFSRIHCCCLAVDTPYVKLVLSSWLRRVTFCAAPSADSCTSCAVECAAYQRTLHCSGLLRNVNECHRAVVPVGSCVMHIPTTQCHCTARLVKRRYVSSATSQIHFAKVKLCTRDIRLTRLRTHSQKKR